MLVLFLKDKGLDTVVETDDEEIAKENGVDAIIKHFNRLYKKGFTSTNINL